jgi:hypothetical protein
MRIEDNEPSNPTHLEQGLLINKDFKPRGSYPIISNNPSVSLTSFDSPSLETKETIAHKGSIKNVSHKEQTEAINILQGRREGALTQITGAY